VHIGLAIFTKSSAQRYCSAVSSKKFNGHETRALSLAKKAPSFLAVKFRSNLTRFRSHK